MTTRNYEIFDRYGNRVEDDDILPDGGRFRVPLMLRDADTLTPLQRAIAQDKAVNVNLSDALCRHQPGPVSLADRAGLERKARAYAEMVSDLENAWRNPSSLAAPAAVVAPRWDAMPAGPVYDAAEGRRIKAAAYQEMVDEMTNAWRTPSADTAAAVTDTSALRKTSDREVARVHNTGDARRDAYLDDVADLTSAWQRS